MTDERVILYPDPEQKVENLWFEIGHFLGFQNVEGYRIIPPEDHVGTTRLAAMGSLSYGLQGIELDATAAMLLKLRFQMTTPEAHWESQNRRLKELLGGSGSSSGRNPYLPMSSIQYSHPRQAGGYGRQTGGTGLFQSLFPKVTP